MEKIDGDCGLIENGEIARNLRKADQKNIY